MALFIKRLTFWFAIESRTDPRKYSIPSSTASSKLTEKASRHRRGICSLSFEAYHSASRIAIKQLLYCHYAHHGHLQPFAWPGPPPSILHERWTMCNQLDDTKHPHPISKVIKRDRLQKQSPLFILDRLLSTRCQSKSKHKNMASPEQHHPLLSGGGFQQQSPAPLPQEYFNRYQYQTLGPQQAPTTHPPPATALDFHTMFTDFVYRTWFNEFLSCLAAFAIFAALVGLLVAFNGHDQEDGLYSEVPSSPITFLVTLMRAFMLLPIASGIAQLKWHWFHGQRNRLSDIEIFDDATRCCWIIVGDPEAQVLVCLPA